VPDSFVITDPYRVPVTALKRDGGGVILRRANSLLAVLNADEFDRLVAFMTL